MFDGRPTCTVSALRGAEPVLMTWTRVVSLSPARTGLVGAFRERATGQSGAPPIETPWVGCHLPLCFWRSAPTPVGTSARRAAPMIRGAVQRSCMFRLVGWPALCARAIPWSVGVSVMAQQVRWWWARASVTGKLSPRSPSSLWSNLHKGLRSQGSGAPSIDRSIEIEGSKATGHQSDPSGRMDWICRRYSINE